MPNVRRSISMEEDVDKALTRYMEATGADRSPVVNEALRQYLMNQSITYSNEIQVELLRSVLLSLIDSDDFKKVLDERITPATPS